MHAGEEPRSDGAAPNSAPLRFVEATDPDKAAASAGGMYGRQEWYVPPSTRHEFRSSFAAVQLGPVLVGTRLISHYTEGRAVVPTPGYSLWMPTSGSSRVYFADGSSSDVGTGNLNIFHVADRKRFTVSDNYCAAYFAVSEEALHARLERLLDAPATGPIRFERDREGTTGLGANLGRLMRLALAELQDPASLFSSRLAIPGFTDWVLDALLQAWPNEHTLRILRQKSPAAPRCVRLAEEYMRAHAGEAIGVEDLADAAGCSTRALQIAFRRFREKTPMHVLRSMRLERAHMDLQSGQPRSVAKVAARWGFSSHGRFARAYSERFGTLPGQTLRRGG